MSLRAKLILAFLLISVLPLTAVTLYSWSSSQRAFRRAAEEQAGAMAVELEHRMELVTDDLGKRVGRLWGAAPEGPLPAGGTDGSAVPAEVPQTVLAALGDAAALIDRLEFLPRTAGSPPPSGAGPPTGGAPAPLPEGDTIPLSPLHGAIPATTSIPPSHLARRLVLDLSSPAVQEQIRRAIEEGEREAAREMGATKADVARILSIVIGKEAQDLGKAIADAGGQLAEARKGAEDRAKPGADARADAGALRADRELGLPVTREGRLVGNINARLNLDRVLQGVLSMSRVDKGEIPFAVDSARRLYTPRPADREKLAHLDLAARAERGGAALPQGPDGDWVVVTRSDPSGLTFGIARPIGESLGEIRRASVRNLVLGLLVVAAAFALMLPLSARLTRDVSTLTGGVQRIARGDLSARVPVRSRDEIGALATAFNQMAQDLEKHEALLVGQERLRRELELCRQIQTEMLPREPLRLGIAEIRGVSIPAREVGGDFFNYFLLPGGEMALLVGDVSGKGVGAALLMANIQATLRARLPVDANLVRLAAAIDGEVERTTPREVYLTLFVGIFDPQSRSLRYVNAGHNPQYLLRASGGLQRMGSTGLPLGLFSGRGFREERVVLGSGDLLFFYTDGAVEAQNGAGELFGTDRLESLLLAAEDGGAETLLARIEEEVRRFRGGAEPSDDATMMALQVGPAAVL